MTRIKFSYFFFFFIIILSYIVCSIPKSSSKRLCVFLYIVWLNYWPSNSLLLYVCHFIRHFLSFNSVVHYYHLFSSSTLLCFHSLIFLLYPAAWYTFLFAWHLLCTTVHHTWNRFFYKSGLSHLAPVNKMTIFSPLKTL